MVLIPNSNRGALRPARNPAGATEGRALSIGRAKSATGSRRQQRVPQARSGRRAGYFAVTIAVTSTSTIISGKASALTPIRVCTGNVTPPQDSPMHLPIVRRWRRSVM